MNDSKKEVMLILQEECAEVTQAISKCFKDNNNTPKNKKNKAHGASIGWRLIKKSDGFVKHNIKNKSKIFLFLLAKLKKRKNKEKINNKKVIRFAAQLPKK